MVPTAAVAVAVVGDKQRDRHIGTDKYTRTDTQTHRQRDIHTNETGRDIAGHSQK